MKVIFKRNILNLCLWLGLLCVSAPVVAAVSTNPKTADHYVQKARQKTAEQDYAGAAILYQQALKLDKDHPIARQELKSVLLESRMQDPEAEFSDAEWSLIDPSIQKDQKMIND